MHTSFNKIQHILILLRIASIFVDIDIFLYAKYCVFFYFSSHLIFYLILHYIMIRSNFEILERLASNEKFHLLRMAQVQITQ